MASGKEIIAAIQARMNSSRLPGKPLMLINDLTMLEHIFSRLRCCEMIDLVCVATTDTAKDDDMVVFLEEKGIPYFRGPEEDIAGRLLGAVKKFEGAALVRVWGDCPLIAPGVIDMLVKIYKDENADFATNSEPPTFPFGMNAEVYSRETLEKIVNSTEDHFYREFPIEFIKDSVELKMVNLSNDSDVSDIKFTVDYSQDAEVVAKIISDLKIDDNNPPRLDSIVKYCRENAGIFEKSRDLPRNVEYKDELKTRGREHFGQVKGGKK